MRQFLRTFFVAAFLLAGVSMLAQNRRHIDNYRYPDQRGVNVFEDPKDSIATFDGVKVRVGGSFALQFQALDHSYAGNALDTDGNVINLQQIGYNFNLATANLDLDVALAPGVRMHLRTYLSSRHHPEPYVKGGYFQIDGLDFISEGLLDNLMKYATIRIGHMENNYGDAHFRRTDNAQAIYNPFVGNLIMDSFTTEIGAEVYYQRNGFIGMVGFTNGKLNQDVKSSNGKTGGAAFIAKLGYDKQISDDLRLRLTGSLYNTGYTARNVLYSADRAGSRYYFVLEQEGASASGNFRSGRFDPGFSNKITAVMINPFVKYRGLEFFGTIEMTSGRSLAESDRRNTNQYAGELIYRFGHNENFYVGGRYNMVDAELAGGDDVTIDRYQFSAGWFMTKNILVKAEYVNQQHHDYATGNILEGGKFHGGMLEAVISF
ncbi:hypothetical protein [Formosa sp. S-31]|uniref:hypothetical protein n=1 Tax=Formosa sp. S-31 TaxID=2790949 RepID=UPI003EB8EEB1